MNVKFIKNCINWCRKNPIKTIIIVVLLFLIGLLIANLSGEHCRPCFIKNLGITETSKFCSPGVLIVRLGYAIGGVIALLVAVASFERVRALDKTADAQEQGNVEERYKNAIEQFGKENPSVRLAGAYGLYHLAKDNEDRRENICNVLCVHIRGITTSKKPILNNESYSEIYKVKPSDEVQSILSLLTKKDSPFKSDQINLENAYLNGANLREAQLQGANLTGVQLQGAYLEKTQLQGANLSFAQLQGTNLSYAQLQGANLSQVQLQGATLILAQLQEVYLGQAQLQGTELYKTQLQGAGLIQAQLQGASLIQAQLQGAYLYNTQLQGTNLSYAQLQGTNLEKANFRGAFTEKDISIYSAIERLNARKNKKDEIENVAFSGGVTKKLLNDFKKTTAERLEELANIKNYNQNIIKRFSQKMNEVEKILENNINKPIDTSIPSEAITGVYPEAEADEIIAMLQKINRV